MKKLTSLETYQFSLTGSEAKTLQSQRAAIRRNGNEPSWVTYNERQATGLLSEYEDINLERFSRAAKANEEANRLIRLLEFKHNLPESAGFDGDEIASVINLSSDNADIGGEDCYVVALSEFVRMREYAVAMYQVLAEITKETTKPIRPSCPMIVPDMSQRFEAILSILKDSDSYSDDYHAAMGFMPDVIKNIE